MKFAIYTVIVSPHQIPFAKEMAKAIGSEEFAYIYKRDPLKERTDMGWSNHIEGCDTMRADSAEAQKWLEECPVLLTSEKDYALMERRCKKHLLTIYGGERWLKPIVGNWGTCRYSIPGTIRYLIPKCRRDMSAIKRLCREYQDFILFPYGEWARRDFLQMGIPEEKMQTWAYTVESSSIVSNRVVHTPYKVLWVGRMIDLKRVDTIIKALRLTKGISLTLVGNGPMQDYLKKLAEGLEVHFMDSVPIAKVRDLMNEHDAYVLSSNGYEGWGAALSEALEEGMQGIGTYEAGASATLLPKENLYHVGDHMALAKIMQAAAEQKLPKASIKGWSAADLAERMVRIINSKNLSYETQYN